MSSSFIRSLFKRTKSKVKTNKPAAPPMLGSFVETIVQGISTSTADNYHTAVRSFLSFNKGKDIALSGMTDDKVRQYERWLKDNGVKNNTASCYLRSLRAIYNKGVIKRKIRDAKPFKGVFTGNEQTVKSSLCGEDMNRLYTLELPKGSFFAFARDLFIFSFCAMGLPPVDLFHLRHSQIDGGKLVYSRHKTGNQVVVPVNKQMQAIIERYKEEGSDLLFPRFAHLRYRLFLSQYNRALKALAAKAGIEGALSSYSARHSWASMANEKGVAIGVISQALGHSNISTTQHYIAKIDCEILRKSNEIVLRNLFCAPLAKRCTGKRAGRQRC